MLKEQVSEIGLVVIKLSFSGSPYFLMRKNDKWNDMNFIGGHVSDRDGGRLLRSAQRELREEVPAFRSLRYTLHSLTSKIEFGPRFSHSRGTYVLYVLQFFLVECGEDPTGALKAISTRSKNRLVAESKMLTGSRGITQFALLLDERTEGGLVAIPLSWSESLPRTSEYTGLFNPGQFDLILS